MRLEEIVERLERIESGDDWRGNRDEAISALKLDIEIAIRRRDDAARTEPAGVKDAA